MAVSPEKSILWIGEHGNLPDRLEAILHQRGLTLIRSSEPADASTTCLALTPVRDGVDEDLERIAAWSETHPGVPLVAIAEAGSGTTSARTFVCGATASLPASSDPNALGEAIATLHAAAQASRLTAAHCQRLRQWLDEAPIGVFEICNGLVSYVNEHMLDSIGYTQDELIGKAPDALSLIHPTERSRVRRTLDQLMRGEADSTPNTYHFARKDGGTYVAEARSHVIQTPEGPIIHGTVRDVTLETHLIHIQRATIQLGETILAEQEIDRILQLVLDAITEHSGFRRAVLSLYDLSIPVPFQGDVHTILTSGLTPEEQRLLLDQPSLPVTQRQQVFSDRYRLGPAYYVPHDDAPWMDGQGLAGTAQVDGWNPKDCLFIPLRGTAGIIGAISVDDPVDRIAPTIASIEPVAALANYGALAVERVFKMRQLEKQKDRVHGLSEFSTQLTRVGDVRTLCEVAVARIHNDLGYSLCWICIADGMRLVHEAVAAADVFPETEVPELGLRVNTAGPGLTRWVFRQAKPVIVPNVSEDARFDGPGKVVRSLMAVPIPSSKGALGVIDVASEHLAAFDDQDLEIISALAGQISTAISSLRRRNTLGRVYAFGQRLAVAASRDEVIASTLEFLIEHFDFEMSGILLSDEEGTLCVVGRRGPYPDTVIQIGQRFGYDEGIIGWVATQKQSVIVPDVRSEPRYAEAHSGTQSELAVPVLFGGHLLGVINVESQQPAFFDDEDRQLLEVVANHLAIALSNLASLDTLRDQAIRDPLTGLFNRHYFNSMISSELQRADRYERPLSLMMIDVDHFRLVNNDFGHLRGDEVLQRIARMIEENVRGADRVIRYGGDEFLVLMPETDGQGDALVVADRLRKHITEVPIEAGIGPCPIGLSIGLYTREPHETQALEEILEEVDQRMYADKRAKLSDGHSD